MSLRRIRCRNSVVFECRANSGDSFSAIASGMAIRLAEKLHRLKLQVAIQFSHVQKDIAAGEPVLGTIRHRACPCAVADTTPETWTTQCEFELLREFELLPLNS